LPTPNSKATFKRLENWELVFWELTSDEDDGIVVVEDVERASEAVIEGLKLTLFGEEIRDRLDARIREHEERVKWWKREALRGGESPEDPAAMPEAMCEHQVERHEWRIEVLTFIREHIQPLEYYALIEPDLQFAELLPEEPDWMRPFGSAEIAALARAARDSTQKSAVNGIESQEPITIA